MKNVLNIIAGLSLIAWVIILFGFNSFDFHSFKIVHILFILAVILAVIGLFLKKKLPGIDSKKDNK